MVNKNLETLKDTEKTLGKILLEDSVLDLCKEDIFSQEGFRLPPIWGKSSWSMGPETDSMLRVRKGVYWKSARKSTVFPCGLITKLCPTLATPWSVACQAPLSMVFFRQEYWSGLPFPSPGDFPDPGFKPRSSALQAGSLLTELLCPGSLCDHLLIWTWNLRDQKSSFFLFFGASSDHLDVII